MIKTTRRQILAAGVSVPLLFLAGCSPASSAVPDFVKRKGSRLTLDDKTYRFVGANLWYGAYLGADAAYGDRPRLVRELDRLKALGITNLRIMASAEEGPLKAGIKPGFRTRDSWNETLFEGLDYCMAEMAKRDMKAVLCLTNFWEWSGGMMTYLHYATGEYVDMNDPAHPWPEFPDRNSDFYRSEEAIGLYHDHVRHMVGRTNKVTGQRYSDDPALMSWQLCNEPRPGVTPEVIDRALPDYYAWIGATAKLIRSIDGNHLLSLGQEGTTASAGREDVFVEAHREMDYLTAHIWPLNWGWVDGKDLAGTWDAGAAKVADYIDTHVRLATEMGKPLVFEEFGFPRDGELYDPEIPTTFRERFYGMIYQAVEDSVASGGPVVGSNFWAWNGEARAAHDDRGFHPGDTAYMGDPPHEPQG
jgi:mannan endo-1,4-beta-mannosidase